MSKEITELEDQLSNINDSQLAQFIVNITKLQTVAKSALEVAKKMWRKRNDSPHARETVTANGQTVGNITITKGWAAKWKVKDQEAYANYLKDEEWTLSNGAPAWEPTIKPRIEACDTKFIDELIEAHNGDVPDCVTLSGGSDEKVTVSLDRHFANDDSVTLKEIANNVTSQIEESSEEDEW